MEVQKTGNRIRLTRNQIRSNPLLESERCFVIGASRRVNERNQMDRLLELQAEGIPIFRTPDLIRVQDSRFKLSEERVGVVGLVVDHSDVGYVTRLFASPSVTWDVASNLPFRAVHLQDLFLALLGEEGVDQGLPELFSFCVTDTLRERCDGDSMDFAGVLSILDSIHGKSHNIFGAACVCVSPSSEGEVEPSKSTRSKLQAFEREIGSGSLLIRHENDPEAEVFDRLFKNVWVVKDLAGLRDYLMKANLFEGLQNNIPLLPEHQRAIAARIELLTQNEKHSVQAEKFISRLKRRFNEDTPLRIRLEILCAEEDLHRHSGRFNEAIEVCHQRMEIENNPDVTCYEHRIQSDNRLAASLYDGHLFENAIGLVMPWIELFEKDPQICLPETRAITMNTLARCLVPLNDPQWEALLTSSRKIQSATDLSSVGRTTNFLIHSYLKTNRLFEAKGLLEDNTAIDSDNYLFWLKVDYQRRLGQTSTNKIRELDKISWENHVYGFIMQSLARQKDRERESRLLLLRNAKKSFDYGVDRNKINIKSLLAIICEVGICFLENDLSQMENLIDDTQGFLRKSGWSSVLSWYDEVFRSLLENPTWDNVDALFERVPHF